MVAAFSHIRVNLEFNCVFYPVCVKTIGMYVNDTLENHWSKELGEKLYEKCTLSTKCQQLRYGDLLENTTNGGKY